LGQGSVPRWDWAFCAPNVRAIVDRHPYALYIGTVAALLLVACGALRQAQDDTLPPKGAMAPKQVVEPNAEGRDLLYVSVLGNSGSTNIYTYPKAKFVSSLQPSSFKMCSNAAGEVFFTETYGIGEYPHGGSTQTTFINAPFGSPRDCAIDPTTGNLATVVQTNTVFGVATYRPEHRHRWHAPRVYDFTEPQEACSYDSAGNLFVAGFTSSRGLSLVELPKGKSAFETITLDTQVTPQGDMKWDGKYLAIGDFGDTVIHRFAINGTAGTQIGSLTLAHAKYIVQFWIQGDTLIGPDSYNRGVGFWRYPQGGAPLKRLSVSAGSGVTVSLARR
jgi:hypothetical protein